MLPALAQLDVEGYAPSSWASFILMFVDLGLPDGGSKFPYIASTQPRRHLLRVTFTTKGYQPSHAVDLESLTCLPLLWTQYRFFVVFKMFSADGSEKSLLEESFKTSVASIYPDWRSNPSHASLHETLVTMSSLQF